MTSWDENVLHNFVKFNYDLSIYNLILVNKLLIDFFVVFVSGPPHLLC